jgi:acetyl-CoA carboxylase carboxyltransferase component
LSWQPEIDEIRMRTEFAHGYGGAEAVERARAAGKGTPRQRIEALLDAGSFRETGTLTGKPAFDESGALTGVTPSNAIIGRGRIEGRRVVVSADDFTVRGGSSESAISDKWIYAERQALDQGAPLVRLVETAGGSVNLLVQSGGTKLPGYASWPLFDLLQEVPVVGIALGACAGLGAVKVAASHFSVMVKGTSQVFAAGPPVVRDGLNLEIDKESLGGAAVHARGSGVVDNEAKSEDDAFLQARRFLSYLPRNVRNRPPVADADDPADRRDDWLLEAVPRETRRVYDTRKILAAVADAGSLFEIGRYWGRSSVTTLARFGGRSVGVLANDPRYFGGAMTVQSAQKIARFVRLCDTFNLPVVSFFDQPGVMIGPDAEKAGTITAALDALTAIDRTRVPWCAVVVRRALRVPR